MDPTIAALILHFATVHNGFLALEKIEGKLDENDKMIIPGIEIYNFLSIVSIFKLIMVLKFWGIALSLIIIIVSLCMVGKKSLRDLCLLYIKFEIIPPIILFIYGCIYHI